jgi:hypothetical protein
VNWTGKPYLGHFNLELKNLLHTLLHATANVIPGQDMMVGWINGWLYAPTEEQICIVCIPHCMHIAADMESFNPGKITQHFLAQSQSTKFTILPVGTEQQKKHYGEMMRQVPSASSHDWVAAAKIWN